MFRILLLFHIFQSAKSNNISLVHRYNIIVTKTIEVASVIDGRGSRTLAVGL